MSVGLIYRRARDLLFPRKCAVCNTLLDWYEAPFGHCVLCDDCLSVWKAETEQTCEICGKRVLLCECMPEAMEKAKSATFCKLAYYQHATRDTVPNRLVYYIKQTRDCEAPLFFAEQLLPALRRLQRESAVEEAELLITYIPRGRRAKLTHGTDQAETLARALSKVSGIAYKRLIYRRRGQDKEQKTLSATARLQNAKLSFSVSPHTSLHKKTLILVDDIVTTGAGMAVCTRLLRRAGAQRVWCLAVASDDVNRERK